MPRVSKGNIWSWEGTVSRTTYALVGTIGFAIKNNLDRWVARYFLPDAHSYFNYWAPLGKLARLTNLSRNEKQLLLALLFLAIPFIWVGVAMTVRRLREAGQPLWLACFFFLPFLNLLFFLALCLLPPKSSSPASEAAPWPRVRPLDPLIPRGKLASALVAIFVTTLIGLAAIWLGTVTIGGYGWSLFVALPFCMGLFSVLMYSYHEPRSFGSCMEVAVLPVGILGLLLLGVAVEGIICLLMAAPIALFLVMLGGTLGFVLQEHYWIHAHAPGTMAVILLALPSLFYGEQAAALQPPEFAVRSAVEIAAPPEKVWNEVVAFTEIGPPQELLFRAGVGYPIRAEITGTGVGAVRHCIFSTGAFEEPITEWDEPRLLKFTVTHTPEPLNELTPYGHISPPHLHGYFVSHAGQFLLTQLPDGRTRLEGTTWYQHTMWPATYWHWWSDYVIHRIHMRVLKHIRALAEAGTAQAVAGAALAADSSTR